MEENKNNAIEQSTEMQIKLREQGVLGDASKRKWTSYVKEFLMLFLAVFCGFLAENYRDNLTEKQREKQFILSFIEDLKADTSSIKKILIFRHTKMEQMDSLMFLLRNKKIKGHENDLYFFGRTLVRSRTFQSTDRTIIQLKNSGSMRLIQNEKAADSIIAYQKLVELITSNQQDDRTERYNAFPVLYTIFDPFVFDQMVTVNGIKRPLGNPPLRSYEITLQQDLAHCIHQLKGSTFLMEGRLKALNLKAINTIDFLQKEYHLE